MLEIKFSIGYTYFLFEIARRKSIVAQQVQIRTGQNGYFFAASTVLRYLHVYAHILKTSEGMNGYAECNARF